MLLGIYVRDVHNDRKMRVVLGGPTPAFSEGSCFPGAQKKIAMLTPSDSIAVRRVRYPKDCMVVRVKLKSGQEGYIVSGTGEWTLK